MPNLKPLSVDSVDGLIILTLQDEDEQTYAVPLNTIDAAHLIGGVRTAIEDTVGHPLADNYGLPGMTRVQYVETQDEIYFRVFLTDRLFHEYPVPKGTWLADELKRFADRVEARNSAKATHQPPGSPGGRN